MVILATLYEFINENSKDKKFKEMIDDFCEFPEGKIRSTLLQQAKLRIDDIIMFHRFVMVTHENNRQIIEPAFKAFNEHYLGLFDNIQHDDIENLTNARMVFPDFDIYKQQEQVKRIANESLVINLWATIEQYANRTLGLLLLTNTVNSHKWEQVEKKFAVNDIHVKSFSSHDIIDELRVLNNKIKHSYCVDNKLAEFPYFSEYNGKAISEVPLRVQDYAIATYHFINRLINAIGPSERYPDDEEEN